MSNPNPVNSELIGLASRIQASVVVAVIPTRFSDTGDPVTYETRLVMIVDGTCGPTIDARKASNLTVLFTRDVEALVLEEALKYMYGDNFPVLRLNHVTNADGRTEYFWVCTARIMHTITGDKFGRT